MLAIKGHLFTNWCYSQKRITCAPGEINFKNVFSFWLASSLHFGRLPSSLCQGRLALDMLATCLIASGLNPVLHNRWLESGLFTCCLLWNLHTLPGSSQFPSQLALELPDFSLLLHRLVPGLPATFMQPSQLSISLLASSFLPI